MLGRGATACERRERPVCAGVLADCGPAARGGGVWPALGGGGSDLGGTVRRGGAEGRRGEDVLVGSGSWGFAGGGGVGSWFGGCGEEVEGFRVGVCGAKSYTRAAELFF